MMALQITTLSENTAGLGKFLGEWGLSILVETGRLNILLDTGQSNSALHNAELLGIELGKINKIILSHGHYDHTGGLCHVLRRIRRETEIIAHPDIWQVKYAIRQNEERYIGIPYHRQTLESLGARFNLSAKPVRINENIMTSGEIPMVTDYEEIEPYLVVKEKGGFKPDKLLDDQALVINIEAGLVVILGCAHRGIINTLYYAQKLSGVKKIYAVLGGCHLMDATEERIYLTIAALKELGVERIGVSHCTGPAASAIMAQEFGERFFFNIAGTRINL